jgi:hypothetical protein
VEELTLDFHRQWLDLRSLETLNKDPNVYPDFAPALRVSMAAELEAFLGHVFSRGGDGRLGTLLRASFSFVDDKLAKVYGLSGPSSAAPTRRELDPRQRAGLLTQAGFLATHASETGSHPVLRGLTVYKRLLCASLPPPPDEVPVVRAPTPNVSTRERFAEHAKAACASCHRLVDPLGFAFEAYDGMGRIRSTDGGKPIDATGSVTVGGARIDFKDAVELLHALAGSGEVRSCFVRQWLRYALRRLDVEADLGSLGAADRAFAASGGDLRELLVAIAQSKTFRYREPAEGERTP